MNGTPGIIIFIILRASWTLRFRENQKNNHVMTSLTSLSSQTWCTATHSVLTCLKFAHKKPSPLYQRNPAQQDRENKPILFGVHSAIPLLPQHLVAPKVEHESSIPLQLCRTNKSRVGVAEAVMAKMTTERKRGRISLESFVAWRIKISGSSRLMVWRSFCVDLRN